MNKTVLLSALLIFLASIALTSFNDSKNTASTSPKDALRQKTAEDVNLLFNQMAKVNAGWQQVIDKKQNLESFRSEFSKLRLAYKRIEFIAEYIEPEFIKMNINGAPLPKHIASSESLMHVDDPNGLQTLDELIFSDEVMEEQAKISELLSKLSSELLWFKGLQKQSLSDREIIEASRLSMVRTFTLSLTGFDCPGSVNSIQEALVVFESIHFAFQLYSPYVQKNFKKNQKNLNQLFATAQDYLKKNQDFDSFDRLTFLTQYINPIYAGLLDLQDHLGIEHKNTKHAKLQPWVSTSRNLFEEQFLNKYYYTGIDHRSNKEALTELGKLLFFDPILSASNDRSCASCHDPNKAFTDGKTKSIATGMEGTVERNAPSCIDAVFSDRYFHDLRADILEDQIEHVVYSEKEFNTSYEDISRRLSQSDEYLSRFKNAFPEFAQNPINQGTIANAMSAYVASLTSFNSPFDQYVRGESKKLSAEAKNGFNLFMGKAACGTCHFAPVFNGLVPPNYQENESEVIGVPFSKDTVNPRLDGDLGRGKAKVHEQVDIFRHSFKTPTVRNVALTAPYMHNGVYETLEEVMEFYKKGGGVGLGIDIPNQTLPFDQLSLNDKEINDIISFMQTLTDTTGLTEIPKKLPSFSDVSLNNRKIGGNY